MIRKFLIGLLYVPLIIMIINHFSAEKNPGDIPSETSNQSDGAVIGSHSENSPVGVYGDSNGQWVNQNSTNEFSFHVNQYWRDNFPIEKVISSEYSHKTISTLGFTHPDRELYSARSRRHHMLVDFYENPRRYSEGFEKIYKIFEKYNVPHNTYLQACLFNELCHSQFYMANADRELNKSGYRYEAVKDKDGRVKSIRREYGKLTGKDMADSRRRYMLGLLIKDDIFIYEGETKVSEETAALMVQEMMEIEYKSLGRGLFWYDYGEELRDGEYYLVN